MGNCCSKGSLPPPQPHLQPLSSLPPQLISLPISDIKEGQQPTSPSQFESDVFLPSPNSELQSGTIESPPAELIGLTLSSREDSPPPEVKERLAASPAPAPLSALHTLASAVPNNPQPGNTQKIFTRKILFPNSTRDLLVSFASAAEYKAYFLALLDLELAAVRADVSKRLGEGRAWEVERRDGRYIYRVQANSVDNFAYGDLFVLANRSGSAESVTVTDIDDKGKTLEFTADISGGETVEFVQSLAHIRMTSQLCNVPEEHPLLPLVLGDPTACYDYPSVSPYTPSASLDSSQLSAISQALSSKLTLVRGPPGSGKTLIAAHIAQELAKSGDMILLCAPSNIAADQLSLALNSLEIAAIRLYSTRMEEKGVALESLSFHKLLRDRAKIECPGDMQGCPSHLTRAQLQRYLEPVLYSSLCMALISEYQVVVSTCLSACDPDIRDISFQSVIIDEATSCIEPEAMAAVFASDCRRLVLLGDPQGLRPKIVSEEAARRGLEMSLMERLDDGSGCVLTGQYRMNPVLAYFPLAWFHSIEPKEGLPRLVAAAHPLDVFARSPLVFVNCKGREEPYESTHSRRNLSEARLVVSYLQKLLLQGFPLDSIGIITAYEGQRRTILDLIRRKVKSCSYIYDKVEIGTADLFQGRELEVVIVSCVRGNLSGGGFLKDESRVNVALTRARRGLVVVGSAEVLRGDETWSSFLDHVNRFGDWVGPKEVSTTKAKTTFRFSA